MLKPKSQSKKSILLAAIVLFTFVGVPAQILMAAESGCVTCHLDQEMLKKNIAVAKGAKSAMQSGAG